MQLLPVEMAGIGYFRQENCASCHTVGGGNPKIGPDLADGGIHKTAAWMIQHFKRPAAMVPGSAMPAIQLSDAQLNTLAAFLLKLNARNAEALQLAPDFAVEGALIYQKNQCGSCHIVNGVGVKLGPPLNGLKRRRTQEWVEKHFQNPQALSRQHHAELQVFSSEMQDRCVFTCPAGLRVPAVPNVCVGRLKGVKPAPAS